jgi:hypothetical protein
MGENICRVSRLYENDENKSDIGFFQSILLNARRHNLNWQDVGSVSF